MKAHGLISTGGGGLVLVRANTVSKILQNSQNSLMQSETNVV